MWDAILLGGGASGLFCAIEAAKRGKKVLVIEHANKVGKKILMSGGGRCNFTNYDVTCDEFLSENPHFCKSALAQYTHWDFIAAVSEANIEFHEKELGQLFCSNSAKDLLNWLLEQASKHQVTIKTGIEFNSVEKIADEFVLQTSQGSKRCKQFVVATGGLSIPTMGATGIGYQLAEQFGHQLIPTRASLVPFTWNSGDKSKFESLSGLSVPATVSCENKSFNHQVLFTHRGLSGPALIQLSNYWQEGEKIYIDWLPQLELEKELPALQKTKPTHTIKQLLKEHFPKKWRDVFWQDQQFSRNIGELSAQTLKEIAQYMHQWPFQPGGTEGYRTAEVTKGGVNTQHISSKTMESQIVPNLYFIGEVLDVTGHLGGYNFQWAWSSAWVAAQQID